LTVGAETCQVPGPVDITTDRLWRRLWSQKKERGSGSQSLAAPSDLLVQVVSLLGNASPSF
jgi:hypothetical protein